MIYSKENIKAITVPIFKKHKTGRAYLFGSYAKNIANEQSDIDIRIERGNLRGMFALSSLLIELEEALNKKVDLISAKPEQGTIFCKNLENEEELIYEPFSA